MPKLIDYPRTSYAGAWELSEVVDDTGGKCAIDTAARKLNRKVSGSFKAIIGSAVKFGLLTSKRDLLTSTTLFKRIKHAYDKQEELLFHREAFLTPPLFTQICRKFRSRELPVQMLDVMLIREFGVEEINAQGVSKAFVEGCRMVGLLDENNIIADIDALAGRQAPRRELANPRPGVNTFRSEAAADTNPRESPQPAAPADSGTGNSTSTPPDAETRTFTATIPPSAPTNKTAYLQPTTTPGSSMLGPDAITSLFGLLAENQPSAAPVPSTALTSKPIPEAEAKANPVPSAASRPAADATTAMAGYQLQMSGPGVNTTLSITEEADIAIAIALLEKIRRQLNA